MSNRAQVASVPKLRRGPWPWIVGGMLVLHASAMMLAIRTATTGTGREVLPTAERPAAVEAEQDR